MEIQVDECMKAWNENAEKKAVISRDTNDLKLESAASLLIKEESNPITGERLP
jgi:hypothetical protein